MAVKNLCVQESKSWRAAKRQITSRQKVDVGRVTCPGNEEPFSWLPGTVYGSTAAALFWRGIDVSWLVTTTHATIEGGMEAGRQNQVMDRGEGGGNTVRALKAEKGSGLGLVMYENERRYGNRKQEGWLIRAGRTAWGWGAAVQDSGTYSFPHPARGIRNIHVLQALVSVGGEGGEKLEISGARERKRVREVRRRLRRVEKGKRNSQ